MNKFNITFDHSKRDIGKAAVMGISDERLDELQQLMYKTVDATEHFTACSLLETLCEHLQNEAELAFISMQIGMICERMNVALFNKFKE